jgi:hypothetical protein
MHQKLVNANSPPVSPQAHLQPDIGIAWVLALHLQWPDLSLAEIRRIDEDLVPAFLADRWDPDPVSHLHAALHI